MIPLVKFDGYWYSEPENKSCIWLNMVNLIYVIPYGDHYYRMSMLDTSDDFIVHEDQITIVGEKENEEDWATAVLKNLPEGVADAS